MPDACSEHGRPRRAEHRGTWLSRLLNKRIPWKPAHGRPSEIAHDARHLVIGLSGTCRRRVEAIVHDDLDNAGRVGGSIRSSQPRSGPHRYAIPPADHRVEGNAYIRYIVARGCGSALLHRLGKGEGPRYWRVVTLLAPSFYTPATTHNEGYKGEHDLFLLPTHRFSSLSPRRLPSSFAPSVAERLWFFFTPCSAWCHFIHFTATLSSTHFLSVKEL